LRFRGIAWPNRIGTGEFEADGKPFCPFKGLLNIRIPDTTLDLKVKNIGFRFSGHGP